MNEGDIVSIVLIYDDDPIVCKFLKSDRGFYVFLSEDGKLIPCRDISLKSINILSSSKKV
tara:strand:+ start:266 stop:445 length:180 start_codon:yes stop_codon:yes gene_type:complete